MKETHRFNRKSATYINHIRTATTNWSSDKMNKSILSFIAMACLFLGAGLWDAQAQAPEAEAVVAAVEEAAPEINSGDTAWMIVASALVLFMTLPGLALFYGGLVRSKNILSVLVQCYAMAGIMTLIWVIYGYSMAFNTDGMVGGEFNFNSLVGGLGTAFLSGLTPDSVSGTIPEAGVRPNPEHACHRVANGPA
jgi:uncharacterized protein with PQ loop repeat